MRSPARAIEVTSGAKPCRFLLFPNSTIVKGSARLALEVEPPFNRYVLIERATRRASEPTALKSEFPARKIEIINDAANDAIVALCKETNWRCTRNKLRQSLRNEVLNFWTPQAFQLGGVVILKNWFGSI
jgi:hypothetical protein